MRESIIKTKSFDFAVRIVEVCKSVRLKEKEYNITSQLLRSGTSIGANVREALNGVSKRDFIYKMTIAQKECDETRYWLELLKATEYISQEQHDRLHSDATELLKIIRSIVLTTREREKL